VRVYSDNDLSASKDDVVRPEFEKMREAIRRGECAHLWCVEQNRLSRNEQWFILAKELTTAGINKVHTKRNGVVDVDSVVSGILAVIGMGEIKTLTKRVIDKQGELATQGRPAGRPGYGHRQIELTKAEEQRLQEWQQRQIQARALGTDMRRWKEENPRPLGGKPILDDQGRKSAVIVPEEAAIIRESAHRVLNGWSLARIEKDLIARGVKGKDGGRMTATPLMRILTAPSVAGLRVYRGEVVGKATWEPILDERTWRAVCAALAARKSVGQRPRRSYLLTGGRSFCTACDQMLRAMPSAGVRYYGCSPLYGGCGDTLFDAETLEAHVALELFRHLEEQNAAGMLSEDQHADRRAELDGQLQDLEMRRTELAQMWSRREITNDQFRIMNEAVTDDEKTAQQEMAQLPAPAAEIDPEELRAAWPELSLDECRKFVDDWIEKITVSPNPGAGKKRGSLGKAVTLPDVAKRAECSVATVKYVMNGKRRTSPEVQTRVRTAINELGYVPGHGGYARRSGNTDRVVIDWR
jgi:hypothetical protein